MKRIAIIAFALFAALFAGAGGANAADIYHQGGGSLKDGPAPYSERSDHTGWALRGFIGYAMGDRDIKSEANAFLNCRNAYELSEDPEDREQELKDIEMFVADANKAGVFASASNDGTVANIVVPILGAFFNNSDSDDFNSLVFGGEIEHLWHRGQFGFGLAAGVTAYGDAESKTTFAKVPTFFERGTATNPDDGANHGQNGETGLTVSGFASVDRQFDIDLVAKLYYFPTPDLAFHVKAGPSFAKAKVKGGVSVDGTDASLEYENDDFSIGYVVGAGVTKWWSPVLSSTLEVDYKAHSFDANGKKSESLGEVHCFCDDLTVDAAGSTDVDDSVWTIKAATAYHF